MCVIVSTIRGLDFLIVTFQDCIVPSFQIGRGNFPKVRAWFKPRLVELSKLVIFLLLQSTKD